MLKMRGRPMATDANAIARNMSLHHNQNMMYLENGLHTQARSTRPYSRWPLAALKQTCSVRCALTPTLEPRRIQASQLTPCHPQTRTGLTSLLRLSTSGLPCLPRRLPYKLWRPRGARWTRPARPSARPPRPSSPGRPTRAALRSRHGSRCSTRAHWKRTPRTSSATPNALLNSMLRRANQQFEI